MTTPPNPRVTTDPGAAAATLVQAHRRWRRLSTVPRSWTEPDRQRLLAAAFLDFHAAKLALTEMADTHRGS